MRQDILSSQIDDQRGLNFFLTIKNKEIEYTNRIQTNSIICFIKLAKINTDKLVRGKWARSEEDIKGQKRREASD